MQAKMKYKAVIFDLDGTLLDTLQDLAGSVNHALRMYAGMTRDVDQIRSFVGNGVRTLMTRSLPGGQGNPRFEEAFAEFKAHYAMHCHDATKPYPGIAEMLQCLASGGYKLAIVSNKTDPEVKKLNDMYFHGLFSSALGEREGTARKPAPDMLCQAAGGLGVRIEEAVYVGDSEVDIQTARNAGMDCIAVSWGFRSREWLKTEGARVVIDDPAMLPALL